MPLRSLRARVLLLACLLSAIGPAVSAEPGYFGFGLKLATSGFFLNPTVRELRVASVAAGTPAAQAGIQPGDIVVAVEGSPVAGSKALALRERATRSVGQVLHLTLRRADGTQYAAALVAAPRPD